MATAAESQGLSPGFKFNPSVEQLLCFFLLPYLRHQRLLVDGVVFLDDPASAPPWALLHRHGRGGEDEAYFIGPVPAGDGHGGRRQQQVSLTVTGGGGGKWIKQRTERPRGEEERVVVFGGETFRWEEFSLNFHADERCRSGSTGWVMHEFAVVPPAGSRVAATHTACRIAFTGHGQKRKRVPDGYVFVDVHVQTAAAAAAAVPPPLPMLCSCAEPPHPGASHVEHFSDDHPPPHSYTYYTQEYQQFLPAAEQSDQEQEYCLPEQQNFQDYHVAAAEQTDQDYFYTEMINQEQDYAYQQQDYAYQQQQQHLFHGDPLATSQQFLGQDHEVMFTGLGGGLVVSDNGELAAVAAPATEPPVHDVFLETLVPEPPENAYVDGAGESAMASASSAGGAPLLEQPFATPPQQFLDQEPAPAGLNDGGAMIYNNNGDGEHDAAPAAQPPARYYSGPVPAVDSVFLDKMREYLMADAKELCRIPVEHAPTNNGDHAAAPASAADDPLAAQHGHGSAPPPPPVPPDTAELERVVGHLLREVEDIIKVAAAGGYGGSSDKPLSSFDQAQNQILAKLMVVFNQVAES
uniref:NAC domain-containing protein n=1 Tax=Oryza glumipatula TaxID=40148 RepID=A0A0D9YQQ6_9ORYZ